MWLMGNPSSGFGSNHHQKRLKMQLPQQVSEQGSENDVTLTLSQETNDQSTLSEPSRDHHHYIEETTGFIFDRFDLVEAVARTAGGESPMKLVCDFGSGYVLLKDKIDYLVSTQADCELSMHECTH